MESARLPEAHDDWLVRTRTDGGNTAFIVNPLETVGRKFDEILVGRWMHAEKLEDREWYLGLGNAQLYIRLDDDGNVESITFGDTDKLILPDVGDN